MQSLEYLEKHSTVKGQYFLSLLDTHSGSKSGVPGNVFRDIFYVCEQCGRHMTQRIASSHHEDADLGDVTCINRKLIATAAGTTGLGDTIYAHKNNVKRVPIPFPELEPLYK